MLTFVQANRRTFCNRKAVKTHNNAGQTEKNIFEAKRDKNASRLGAIFDLLVNRRESETPTQIHAIESMCIHTTYTLLPSLHLYEFVLPNTKLLGKP